MTRIRFPDGFEWGTATAAYQIEGAAYEDGRGLSIWDVFCKQPGRVQNGDHGDVACDHYHRMPDDVALMKSLGIQSYRFSISWPRVLPFGTPQHRRVQQPINERGIDFYSRLVDALLAAGITPCPTLYHWDLPQALQDRGGWAFRDTAAHFADYAGLMYARLGDRVERWITHNEPWVVVTYGHRVGPMAPGIAEADVAARATHHILLSHGLAVERYRAEGQGGAIGITNSNSSYEPAEADGSCDGAVELARDFDTRLYTGAVLGRGYPDSVLRHYEARGVAFPIEDGDMATIAAPTDFVGVNLYSRTRVRPADSGLGFTVAPPTLPLTPMGYERAPHALGDFVRFLSAEYERPKIYITENGVCDNTEPVDGEIDDVDRESLLRGFLEGLHRAIEDGADVRGYYLWSLLDNFEWSFGYSKRFGIVHTDYDTLQRTPKRSAGFYRDVIANNGFD